MTGTPTSTVVVAEQIAVSPEASQFEMRGIFVGIPNRILELVEGVARSRSGVGRGAA